MISSEDALSREHLRSDDFPSSTWLQVSSLTVLESAVLSTDRIICCYSCLLLSLIPIDCLLGFVTKTVNGDIGPGRTKSR